MDVVAVVHRNGHALKVFCFLEKQIRNWLLLFSLIGFNGSIQIVPFLNNIADFNYVLLQLNQLIAFLTFDFFHGLAFLFFFKALLDDRSE